MHLAASSRVAACTRSLDQPSYNPLRIVFDILGEEMPVGTYSGLGYWTPQGYWRFPVGSDREEVGGFRKTLREHATDPELAIKEWEEFRGRLKDLCGTMSAVSLMNLRQDAGFLATTAGGAPFVMTHPWVLPDLPLVFESLHETVDKIVTEPFLRNWIDTMCIFCGFPAKGAMTAHILYILDRFFEEGACYSVPIGGTEQLAITMIRGLEKFGGKLQMNAHVAQILTEDGRAVGVQLKNGKIIKAKKARAAPWLAHASPSPSRSCYPHGSSSISCSAPPSSALPALRLTPSSSSISCSSPPSSSSRRSSPTRRPSTP